MTTCTDCGNTMEKFENYWCCHTCKSCSPEIEVYSRCVGYLRPIQQYNPGKKQEFKDRKVFKI